MGLKICFIGDGNHAKRIQKILLDLNVNYSLVECDRSVDIEKQSDVMDSHVIFITSPNNTHAYYLNKLSDYYNGYVFCEKPPVNRLADFKILDKINSEKFFFGFNLRFSEIIKIIKDIDKEYDFGELINVNIHVAYPFSVKDEYSSSWKSDIDKSPCGIVENLGIHYIDLSVELLGNIVNTFKSSRNVNQTGSADDTATIFCLFENNNSTSQIFVSYSTIYRESMHFTFENGSIDYDGNEFKAYYPRETFNKKGFSVHPPLIYSKEINSELLYYQSLLKCIKEFTDVVLTNGSFNQSLISKTKASVLAMF